MEKIEIYIGCDIKTYDVPYAKARAVEILLREHKTTERTNEERLKEWDKEWEGMAKNEKSDYIRR